jgi:uncharacterized protein (DUF58 family)
MRPLAPRDSIDPLLAPLLDRAELATLIAQGERLARHLPATASDAGRHGGEAARRFGEGMDFAEHRRYQPGDDPRRINWRLTARHGEPHVRRYHEDVTAPYVLLVDRRATMRFATRGRLKATQAVRLAMLLAGLHAARQALVNVVELDTRLHRHAATGAPGLLQLGSHLAAPCPPTHAAGPALAKALLHLEHTFPPGARLILLSDFADADTVGQAQWHRLARRFRVDAVVVEDPAEIVLPAARGVGLYWQGDAGIPLDQGVAQRLAQDHEQRLGALRATLASTGIGLQRLDTRRDDLTDTVRGLSG